MCTKFDGACHGTIPHNAGIARRIGIACVAAGLSTVGATWLAAATIPDKASAGTTAEESVLVATREAAESQRLRPVPTNRDADESDLEPISQTPERTPELADLASAEADPREDDQLGAKPGHAAAESPKLEVQPAKFNGIQPGKSTKEDLLSAWKEPLHTETTDDKILFSYEVEPFRSVEVQVEGETVAAINIELQGSLTPSRLARQLSLDTLDAVPVTDAEGTTLGQIYPERGVLFMFAPPSDVVAATTNPTQTSVTHVVIQPLDADAFALRAESRLHGPYEQNIEDLKTALLLKPELAHAQWLLAEVYLATGQAERAKEAADEACDVEPENAAYQLRRAQVYNMLGRYDDATFAVRDVLDRESTPPIVKAQALHEMARLAVLGDAEISAKAIAFENRAIALADSLATSKNVKERRAAKQILIEAHLGVARQIAGDDFKNKLESVSQWVGRASGLAEDFIAHDGGSVELRLLVAKESLAALASIKPTKDPGPWISEAEQSVASLRPQWDDDLWRRRLQWELGQVYFQAVRVEHLRLQPAAALRYGQLAIENLADGAARRQAVYDSEQLVGELYFHIGVVHAVQKQDHKTAAKWYDKALPLLAAPRPTSDLLAPQHDGEEFVSMGVSYWQIGEKDHAIDLTLNGAELVEQAVESGILPKKSLAVPYGNLASMYQQLGSDDDAAKYSELARVAGGRPKPAVIDGNGGAANQRTRSMANRHAQQRVNQPVQRTAGRPTATQRN